MSTRHRSESLVSRPLKAIQSALSRSATLRDDETPRSLPQNEPETVPRKLLIDPKLLPLLSDSPLASTAYVQQQQDSIFLLFEKTWQSKRDHASVFRVGESYDLNQALCSSTGNTALHFAVLFHDLSLVILLVWRGARPCMRNKHGVSALELSIKSFGDRDAQSLFLKSAVFENRNEMKSELLAVGGNTPPALYLDSREWSPSVQCHAGHGPLPILTPLQLFDKDELGTPLYFKCIARNHLHLLDSVWSSFEKDPKSGPRRDRFKVHVCVYAALFGHLSGLKQLKKVGVWFEKSNTIVAFQVTPLMAAVYHGHDNVVDYLLEDEQNIHIFNSAVSPLMLAAWKGYSSIVQRLLSSRISWDFNQKWWRQPLDRLNSSVVSNNNNLTSRLASNDPDYREVYRQIRDWIEQVSLGEKLNQATPLIQSEIIVDKQMFELFPFLETKPIQSVHWKHSQLSVWPENIQKFISSIEIPSILTESDILHLNLCKWILDLGASIALQQKQRMALITAQLVHLLNNVQEKPWKYKKSYGLSRFMTNCLDRLVRDTKLATGIWPPPDAHLILWESAVALLQSFKDWQKQSVFNEPRGQWRIIDLDAVTTLSPVDANYTSYQKLELLYQLQETHESPTEEDNPSSKIDQMAQQCLDYLDTFMKQFIAAVQHLKSMKDSDLKTFYNPATYQIFTLLEMAWEELREMEFFYHLETHKMELMGQWENWQQETLSVAQQLLLRGRLASGVWPQQDAAQLMMQSGVELVKSVKEMIQKLQMLVEKGKVFLALEKDKKWQWERRVQETERVRAVFHQLTLNQNTNMSINNNSNQAQTQITTTNISSTSPVQLNAGLILDEKQQIRGGRLQKLVERLTLFHEADPDYQSIFLLTFRSFTTPEQFLSLLFKRYQQRLPSGLDHVSFKRYLETELLPCRVRICSVLKAFLQAERNDFQMSLIVLIRDFIEKILILDFPPIAEQLLQLLNGGGGTVLLQPISSQMPCPKPLLPKHLDCSSFLGLMNCLEPLELARQWTLMDHQLLSAISLHEFLQLAWQRPEKWQIAPRLSKMIQSTNQLSAALCHVFLSVTDLKQRVSLLKYLIQVGQSLMELQNFNGLTCLMAVLQRGPIKRLSLTWKELNKSNLTQFETLSELVSPRGQYVLYRKNLEKVTLPAIPFLGVHLTDLTFIEDGNPDYLQEEPTFVHFEKRRKVAQVVREMQKFMLSVYALERVELIIQLLEEMSKREEGGNDEKELYQQSLQLEPRLE